MCIFMWGLCSGCVWYVCVYRGVFVCGGEFVVCVYMHVWSICTWCIYACGMWFRCGVCLCALWVYMCALCVYICIWGMHLHLRLCAHVCGKFICSVYVCMFVVCVHKYCMFMCTVCAQMCRKDGVCYVYACVYSVCLYYVFICSLCMHVFFVCVCVCV